MKWILRKMSITIIVFIIIIIIISSLYMNTRSALDPTENKANVTEITRWEFMLDQGNRDVTTFLRDHNSSNVWNWRDANQVIRKGNSESDAVWLKFRIPAIGGTSTPSILINKIYAKEISIYVDKMLIYENKRDYSYDVNQILLSISRQDTGKELLIKVSSERERLGMAEEILVGDYQTLLRSFVKENLIDIIFGSTIVFVAFVMLLCSLFLKREQLNEWLSLTIVLISMGTMIITYSPFLYTHYGEYGQLYTTLFDISLLIFLPALTYIFENMIGVSHCRVINKFRKFQVCYSMFCLIFMVINILFDHALYSANYFISVIILGVFIIIQGLLLGISALYYAVKGNKDAMIITTGFVVFLLIVISELLWYFVQKGNYEFYLWKWGIMAFVISLIVLLGRKFALNHRRVVEYSKQLERFNNELQRSEKMDIISELAASVAHEVRNPLQVTKGFLQLLEEKSEPKEKGYLNLALEELERASNIITDFLTFAKPELEQITLIDISREFKHIEGILLPLANFEGGTVEIDIPSGLLIRGNSSKFKQALINMIKNSIEALGDQGLIRIWAYTVNGEIQIHIHDNGQGMDAEEIIRLGEPYYSNKTKGTGLGLMVTFRIIEAMDGTITFTSEKGIGTVAIICFPAAREEDDMITNNSYN